MQGESHSISRANSVRDPVFKVERTEMGAWNALNLLHRIASGSKPSGRRADRMQGLSIWRKSLVASTCWRHISLRLRRDPVGMKKQRLFEPYKTKELSPHLA